MFRSLELIGLVTNIDKLSLYDRQREQPLSSHDKLILFDLVNIAPKQPGPTDS
jgi:hypothetical protein